MWFVSYSKRCREYIKKEVDYITPSKGGEGVFRDVADMILQEQNLLNNLIQEIKGIK